MTASEQSGNLYTRELVQLLTERGLELADLIDQVGLDPSTVERLRQSLTDPRLTPVPSADEQEFLVTGLLLNTSEQRRLLAALMATAIQRLLQDQLGQTSAQQFITQAYPFLLTASLQANLDTLGAPDRISDHEAQEDQTWKLIWDMLDASALAFQVSNGRGLSSQARARHLHEAQEVLAEVIVELERLSKASKASPVWHTCHTRATRDLKAVLKHLRQVETKQ